MDMDVETYRLLRQVEQRDIEPEVALAAQLGMDVETYRLLRQLEQRDIMPEDYDVLLMLDESVAPKTLEASQLRRFPTEVYGPPEPEDPAAFGLDFWRLPVLDVDASAGSPCGSARGDGGRPACDERDVCAVCYVEFQNGDAVRRLPCGH